MKTILIFISLLFYVMYVSGQTNYYSTTKTFYESGYTYQCDVASYNMVTLYNNSNKWTYSNVLYKSTGEVFVMPDAGLELTCRDNWTRAKRYSIVNSAFSDSEKQRIKNCKLFITMCISSTTGKVDEVYFEFLESDPYAAIPVSVYRKIETELKKNIWYTLAPEGKKLNYIFHSWAQELE